MSNEVRSHIAKGFRVSEKRRIEYRELFLGICQEKRRRVIG